MKQLTLIQFFNLLGILLTTTAWAQNKWGTEDQRGAANYITEAKVVEAAKLISKGKIYELGHTYEASMPLGGRMFHLNIISSPPSKSPNSFVFNTDFFAGHIGQIGTQFDAFGHFGYRGDSPMEEDIFYNGFKGSEIYSSAGLKKLGVENAKPFFTRGILIDVADYKGVQRLEPGYEITPEDLKGSLSKQGISIKVGDVVLIRTGHSQLWHIDGAAYYNWKAEPGIGTSAGKWLADQNIVIIGSDNFAVEVIPFDKTETKWPIHLMMLKDNGIHLLESLNLEGLHEDQVYEFAFIFSPLPIKGASGSPGNPIAIK